MRIDQAILAIWCSTDFEQSVHSTISVLEGFHEYQANGYDYRLPDILAMTVAAREFVLQHRLFRSDRTGEIIQPQFLRLSFPSRWKYDILRALHS